MNENKNQTEGINAGASPLAGIVGGQGRMGRWFERFFKKAGLSVLIADKDTELSAEDIAMKCDVVVLSVPMEVFPEVVKRIGPLLPEDAFLTDLCSLKQEQVALMLRHSRCEVAGTHPLFGPSEESIKRRRVAICPGRGKRWLIWWEGLLKNSGALTHIVDPALHDRAMAWVQALNHFLCLSLGKALERDGIDLKEILALATPSFERQMGIVARLTHQDPGLYAYIQMANPYAVEALKTFSEQAESIHKIIIDNNVESFNKIFKDVQAMGRALLSYEGEGSIH
ncbi:MAG: prephenate dehydrogenase/arogenate dehydrogenase family protein [Desulfobacteraceae bacterium]|nr:prephenate dehydrogenase/arogenate dehydrogenase family protein [Desulfobacteraceae bacterium]